MTPPLPPQSTRRRDVVLLFASYPLGTWVLHQLLDGSSFYGLAHIAFTVLLLWQLAIERVGRIGKRIADDLDERLDERQLALRNVAYLHAYRFVSGLILVGCIWIALGIDLGYWWVPTTYYEWNDVLWGLFILVTTLPSALLSWREPDRTEDGDEVLQHA